MKIKLLIAVCILSSYALFLNKEVKESRSAAKISTIKKDKIFLEMDKKDDTLCQIRRVLSFERQSLENNRTLQDIYNSNDSTAERRLFILSDLQLNYKFVVENFLTKFKSSPIDSICNFIKVTVNDYPTKTSQTVRVEYIHPSLLYSITDPFFMCRQVMGKYVVVTSPSLSNLAVNDSESLHSFYQKYFPDDYILIEKYVSYKREFPYVTAELSDLSWPPTLSYFNEDEISK